MHQMHSAHSVRPTPLGKVFFVGDSGTVDLSRIKNLFGVDPDGELRYFDDLEECLSSGALVADRGDVILLAPGHNETVTVAAGIDIDVAGITIIGLGTGSLRPTFTFSTATTADIDIDAANVTIENCIFDCTGIDAVAGAIDVNAADFTIRKCFFRTAITAAQCTYAIVTDATSHRLTVEDCQFIGSANSGTSACINLAGADEHIFRRNYCIGNYSATLGAINGSAVSTSMLIEGNFIYNRTAASTAAMSFNSSSTGFVANNRFQILSLGAPIVGAGMSWVGGNYTANAVATAGTLI